MTRIRLDVMPDIPMPNIRAPVYSAGKIPARPKRDDWSVPLKSPKMHRIATQPQKEVAGETIARRYAMSGSIRDRTEITKNVY